MFRWQVLVQQSYFTKWRICFVVTARNSLFVRLSSIRAAASRMLVVQRSRFAK
ncbi:hypothetical protein [Paenibacillus radicis (ex Gao et al. 2016)]|uniref:hypothetical protein n=1 Tax=Paenibacillus radicis (ex Gao et al. 2016) TaxID=1737354 RepID=UPI00166755DB|nr:hypothetical protein [Paenibacillus radicis (ex Gao et al. 2016)]